MLVIGARATRAGEYRQQGEAWTFIPAPLPPNPPVHVRGALSEALAAAEQAVAALDDAVRGSPDPAGVAWACLYRNEVLPPPTSGDGVREVSEGLAAANTAAYGAWCLRGEPLSLELVCRLHAMLLSGGRGEERHPGRFRTTQNWLGNSPMRRAVFLPPPVAVMHDALANMEEFFADLTMPGLLQCGLVHAQFVTIHPFADGNGRLARLLVPLLLMAWEMMGAPALSVTGILRQQRAEYHRWLMAVRDRGDWEGWLTFFLNAVATAATVTN